MEKWQQREFGELYKIPSRNGLSKPSRVRGSGYKMINMGELFSNDRIYNINMELVPLTEAEKEKAKIEKNDLLFARQSLVASGAGKCSIVMETDDLTVFESHLIRVRLNPQIADSMFYYYYFKSFNSPIKAIIQHCVQAGIKASDLEKLFVAVPPLEIQTKISGILSKIDDKIEENNRINKNLLHQAQALFISWFIDYIPFNGTKPNRWKNISVYELAEYINGAAFKKNEYADKGVPIIKITELKNGITDATQYCCTEKDAKYYIDDRDILFSWSGNPDTSIDAFLWSNGKAILNQHTFRVVSKYNAPAFTFFLLKYLKPQFTHIASNKQTTGLGHVTVADLKRLQFCADENTIREFNAITMPFFDMIFSNYKENQYLSSLRDTILPQLMSGELDVSNITL